MVIGIVGLGLIGGSLCKAIKQNTAHTVYGFDLDDNINSYALLDGGIDKKLCDSNIGECDYILLSIYPKATVAFLKEKAELIGKSTTVIDCGGIKRSICENCFELANEYGFSFIGGHPMAGLHFSGYKYAKDDLFCGASMILTPQNTDDIAQLQKVSAFIKSLGFSSVTVTTPDEHDKIIAFTSQLAHVVSNAYVKSPQAKIHKGFSAGSYKDLTRVARLNENMWAELFMENKDNLLFEIDHIINALSQYKEALKNEDTASLKLLLKEGSDRKAMIDN
ncbi:MAG: prephenate dehydrogenase/arogenate dehydrogenase family protein [Ruminococcaceae bacterium]|nr:prephenate dehydrogenase/arogenate dehydrogenase family protein [Oscillospiraceae bacterium]